jgi:ribonuclease P protein component
MPCAAESTAARPFPKGEAPYRLSGDLAYSRLFKTGKRFQGRLVWLIVAPASEDSQPHLKRPRVQTHHGIVIGRKVFKRAVDRNRFKRKCREALRARREALWGSDVVVCAKKFTRNEIDAAVEEAAKLLDEAILKSKDKV